VLVGLVIQHAMHMLIIIQYSHLLPVWLYHIFPHYVINGMIFFLGGGEILWNKNVYFDFLYKICLKYFSL